MDEHRRLIERLLDDMRDVGSDVKNLSVSSARHEEILRDRSSVIESSLDRLTLLETNLRELERRTDAHGRKVESMRIAFDAVMQARKDEPAVDWKTNPMIWAIVAMGLIAGYLAFLAFGGEPGAVLDHLPG